MDKLRKLYCSLNEYNPLIVDRYERVPSALANNNAYEAEVSGYLYNEGFRPVYKDGKKFAVCFSHDIDFIHEPKNKNSFFISTIQSLKRGKFQKVIYNSKNLLSKFQNPEWDLNRLIDIEEKHNILSTYYFLCLQNGEQDFNHTIESQLKSIGYLKQAGYEIGLHGGHEAYSNIEKMLIEKQRLENITGENTKGYRNHYLRFKIPGTWYALLQHGFSYDTSFGFAEQLGFRNGMCYPFRPYDPFKKAYIDILELPLIAMDVTFFKYMGLTVNSAFRLFLLIYEKVKKLAGALTIVWHNNQLDGEYGLLYNKIIQKIIEEEDAWVTTSLQLTDWWKENNLSKMEDILNDSILL